MDHGQINHQVSIVSYMFWSIRKTIFWQNKTHSFASLKISSGVGCPTFATEQLEQWITAIFFPKASVHARTQGCLLIHENYKWTAAFPRFLGMNFNAYSKIAWLQIVKKEAYGFLTRKNTLKSQKSSNLILLGASSKWLQKPSYCLLIRKDWSMYLEKLDSIFQSMLRSESKQVDTCRPAHVHVYI